VKARVGVLIVLAALLAGVPAALGGSARSASNSQNFADSINERAGAPDITGMTVSNDDAGLTTFQINISNRPDLTPDMFLLIFLDTDKNSATGDTSSFGADYVIQLVAGSVDLFQWNGTDFVQAASQASLTYAYAPTGATIHASAADLGKTKGFNFAVIVASGVTFDAAGNANFDNIVTDAAPDPGHGVLSYQVLTKLVLTGKAFTTAPKPAKAGKPFSATLAAYENDTAGPVQSGVVTCVATVGGKRIAAVSHVLANGVATCVWRVPATAKGKTIRGTITLNVRGTKLTRPFSSKIV
jgi:hypothetical protein